MVDGCQPPFFLFIQPFFLVLFPLYDTCFFATLRSACHSAPFVITMDAFWPSWQTNRTCRRVGPSNMYLWWKIWNDSAWHSFFSPKQHLHLNKKQTAELLRNRQCFACKAWMRDAVLCIVERCLNRLWCYGIIISFPKVLTSEKCKTEFPRWAFFGLWLEKNKIETSLSWWRVKTCLAKSGWVMAKEGLGPINILNIRGFLSVRVRNPNWRRLPYDSRVGENWETALIALLQQSLSCNVQNGAMSLPFLEGFQACINAAYQTIRYLQYKTNYDPMASFLYCQESSFIDNLFDHKLVFLPVLVPLLFRDILQTKKLWPNACLL